MDDDSSLLAGGSQSLYRGPEWLAQIDRAQLRIAGGGFQTRKRQEVGHQRRKTDRLVPDSGQKMCPIGGTHGLVIDQRLDQGPDGRDRRLEFVGRIGDEVPTNRLQAIQIGNIVENHHSSRQLSFAIQQRRRQHFYNLILGSCCQPQFVPHIPPAFQGTAQGVADLTNPRHFPNGLGYAGFRRGSQDLPGSRIHLENAFIAIDRNHALHHAFQ